MRQFLRAFLPFITFSVIAILCITSQWKWLDMTILGCCWAGFLLLSVMLLYRSVRRKTDDHQWRGFIGQTGGLPQSWRRWILDEKDDVKTAKHTPNR